MTEQTETQTSPEDKFFGIQRTIDDGPEEEEIEVEATHDPEETPKPEKAERPPRQEAQDDDDDDPELADYSERVKKRIKKLTWEKNEERRLREQTEAEKNEAMNLAQNVVQRNQQMEELIHHGEARLVETMKNEVNAKLAHFESVYRKAYEEGDTEAIIMAQKEYFRTQAEAQSVGAYEQDYRQRAHQYVNYQQQRQQQRHQPPPPQVRKPTPRSARWAEENPWFTDPHHRDMQALAYGTHEKLIRERGLRADSDEYYEEIDSAMRLRFPEYFDEETGAVAPASTHRKPPTVVAPGGRNNGAKRRQVKLTQTQRAVASQLGLTDEQYARQLIKEM
jgi:hypothetical protein